MKLYSLTIEDNDASMVIFATDYKKLINHESVKNFSVIEETNRIEEEEGVLTMYHKRPDDLVKAWEFMGLEIKQDCYAWIKVVNNFLG